MPYDDLVTTLRAAGCVFAEDEARVLTEAAVDDADLARMLAERVSGTPLELVVGWAEFCGLRIVVAPGVFVPRQRTAELVRRAAVGLRSGEVAVDLCCGTGALGAALLDLVDGIEVHGADIDPAAVACARHNLSVVHEGDLYAALPAGLRGRVAVIMANAPYVPTDAIALMPPEARDHEARVALDGGADGLDVQRRVIAQAHEWLVPGGRVLVESGREQAPVSAALMTAAGLVAEVDGAVVIGSRS